MVTFALCTAFGVFLCWQFSKAYFLGKKKHKELLADGLIKVRPMNHGYELVVSKKELRARLMPNIDADIRRSRSTDSEIFDVLISINEWINSIKYGSKKNLF